MYKSVSPPSRQIFFHSVFWYMLTPPYSRGGTPHHVLVSVTDIPSFFSVNNVLAVLAFKKHLNEIENKRIYITY